MLTQASFKMREVVVTGMGLISCIGNDLDTVSKNLKAGKSGIKLNQEYVDMGFRSHVCGTIDIDLKLQIYINSPTYMTPKTHIHIFLI